MSSTGASKTTQSELSECTWNACDEAVTAVNSNGTPEMTQNYSVSNMKHFMSGSGTPEVTQSHPYEQQ